MVSQRYPSELQRNKPDTSGTEASFLNWHLSISNKIVSTKIYNKSDDFDFEIVNLLFVYGDVSRPTSYGVYIFQIIRFARASSLQHSQWTFNSFNKAIIYFAKPFLNFIAITMM